MIVGLVGVILFGACLIPARTVREYLTNVITLSLAMAWIGAATVRYLGAVFAGWCRA